MKTNRNTRSHILSRRPTWPATATSTHPKCWPRLKQVSVFVQQFMIPLSKRRKIVQYPKRSALGCNDQVTFFDRKICHRDDRNVALKCFPVFPVVKRNIQTRFCSCKQQSFSLGVGADHTSKVFTIDAIVDRGPGFPIVHRFEQVRFEIV